MSNHIMLVVVVYIILIIGLIPILLIISKPKRSIRIENKQKKRKKTTHKRVKRTRSRVLECITHEKAITIKAVSRITGLSYSSCSKHLKLLNEKEKIVLIRKGTLSRYTLPSEGQTVYKVNKNKRSKK